MLDQHPGFEFHPKTYCTRTYGGHYSLEEAMKKCNANLGCTYIYDRSCGDNQGFQLCRSNAGWYQTSLASACVYRKSK